MKIPLTVQGVTLSGNGRRWQIAGNDPMAYNTPGEPPKVKIEESPVSGVADTISVAPCSVTLYALELKLP